MGDTARHAVYWLPEPDQPLWAAGCAWLGRDPAQDTAGGPPAARAEPWRYGFHATLKAPLVLRAGADVAAFVAAARGLAAGMPPFELPPLAVDELDGFVALRPTAPSPPMQALADRCVEALDGFRAEMPATEFDRRRHGLDAEQTGLLRRWGYPHVFGRWRLHLTLTDRLPTPAGRAAWRQRAAAHFAQALATPPRVTSIAVLEEPAPGRPFRLLARLPLSGVSRSAGSASG